VLCARPRPEKEVHTCSWGFTPSLRSALPAAAAGALITPAISFVDPFLRRFSGPVRCWPPCALASPVAGMLASEASVPSADATHMRTFQHVITCGKQLCSAAQIHVLYTQRVAFASSRKQELAGYDIMKCSAMMLSHIHRKEWGTQGTLTGSG